MKRTSTIAFVLCCALLMCVGSTFAYSVLTHEEIVDLLWKDEIRPLLLKRFPALTEDQITEAHAYASGGAVIQDLGYYPFGSKQFSDLAHYVRSGDMVQEMLLESQDANEYAFAMGALAHYVSDFAGHPAVNLSVAIDYPKLRAKFGNSAQNDTAHIRTEFGFDMVQVAKKRYAPQQYHDFIGFQVSLPLRERVFPVVYGVCRACRPSWSFCGLASMPVPSKAKSSLIRPSVWAPPSLQGTAPSPPGKRTRRGYSAMGCGEWTYRRLPPKTKKEELKLCL